jgi:inward rectifier potassium channel
MSDDRKNQEKAAHVTLSLRDPETGQHIFTPLRLERERINLFPSNWTIVHPIDEDCPLDGMTAEDLRAAEVRIARGPLGA